MARPTETELATALAFVLQKWKQAGASAQDAGPFDELLKRVNETGQAATPVPVRVVDHPRPTIKADEPEDDYRPSTSALDTPDEPDPEWAVGTGDRRQWPPV